MFGRKSGRLNPSYNPSQNVRSPLGNRLNSHFLGSSSQHDQKQYRRELEQQEFKQQRYFNSQNIEELMVQEVKDFSDVPKGFNIEHEANKTTESPEKRTSATTKALNLLELDGGDKKKWKKQAKTPVALRRKKLNQRLSKLLTPKSALILLHELKPGCVYKIQGLAGCVPPTFSAQVELNGEILGTGQGLTKTQAKNSAAENAIKTIVSRMVSRRSENREEGDAESESGKEDLPENLPWAGLASFAMYKMFSEWQDQGMDLLSMARPVMKNKLMLPSVNAPTKKDLPANATELHPAVVLNMVIPGLTAVELERDDTPKCRVKMAYVIDGKVFSGVGGNKKDAKKEAAKAVLEGLYGLTYP